MGNSITITAMSGGGGGSTDVSSKVKSGTVTVVANVAKQITFTDAFASNNYNVAVTDLNGITANDITITDKLASGFKLTMSDSGTANYEAFLKTE